MTNNGNWFNNLAISNDSFVSSPLTSKINAKETLPLKNNDENKCTQSNMLVNTTRTFRKASMWNKEDFNFCTDI